MKPKKNFAGVSTPTAGSTSTMPKKRSAKQSGSGSGLFSPERNRERLDERQLQRKCAELGYTQDENRSYPCWCGRSESNCVWLLEAGKSRGSHFFCLSCTERVPTADYEKVCRDYARSKIAKAHEQNISDLLKG